MRSLNPADAATIIDLDLRIKRVEDQVRQVPSRFPSFPNNERRFRVLKNAHGWDLGSVISRTSGAWTTADGSIGAYLNEPLALVIRVQDVNNVDIILQGWVRAPYLGLDDWTDYYVTPTGTLSTTPNYSSALPGPNGKADRILVTTATNGWLYVHGPDEGTNHVHFMTDIQDVDPAMAPAVGDVLQWTKPLGTVGWWKAGTVAAVSPIAGLSVLANPTATTATASALTASVAGSVLMLNAAGNALTWALVQTTNLNANAVTAAKLGADVTLEALKDVSIVTTPSDSRVANDFLTWNASAWVNRNLGPIICLPVGTGGSTAVQLALDGGAAGTAMAVGIAATGSRLVVSNTNNSIDFIQSGSAGLGTDKSFRWLNNGATMEWRDQAGGPASANGDKVAEWVGSATVANRYFAWRSEQHWHDQTTTAGAGTHYLKLYSTAAQVWLLQDDISDAYMEFRAVDTRLGSASTAGFSSTVVLNNRAIYFGIPLTTGSANIIGTNTTVSITTGAISAGAINLTAGTNGGVYCDYLNPGIMYLSRTGVIYLGDNTAVPKTTTTYISGQTTSVASLGYSISLTASPTGTFGTYLNITDATPVGAGGTGVTFDFKGGDNTVAGSKIDMSFWGVQFKKTTAGINQHGFFGATPVVQQTVNGAITQSGTSPGATYNQANEINMWTDTGNCISAINAMRTLLRNLGFAA